MKPLKDVMFSNPTFLKVKYEVDGFLEKNKDLLPDQVVTVLRFSDMRLVWSLFSSQQNTSTNQLRKSMMRKR